MPYEHALAIERRLESVLKLAATGEYSTPGLAQELEVSIPTVSRCISALRSRGHAIRSQRTQAGWRYQLVRS